jgi:hypothetical protein
MDRQYGKLILSEPALSDIKKVEPTGWRYLRVTFSLWPGQNTIIENVFRQRVIALLKTLYPDYSDWMVTAT